MTAFVTHQRVWGWGLVKVLSIDIELASASGRIHLRHAPIRLSCMTSQLTLVSSPVILSSVGSRGLAPVSMRRALRCLSWPPCMHESKHQFLFDRYKCMSFAYGYPLLLSCGLACQLGASPGRSAAQGVAGPGSRPPDVQASTAPHEGRHRAGSSGQNLYDRPQVPAADGRHEEVDIAICRSQMLADWMAVTVP